MRFASSITAGFRPLLPVLRGVLLEMKARRSSGASAYVFATATGGAQNASNTRNRILAPAIRRANERLEEADEAPLPDHLTPHKLRHSYASLLVALGTDPGTTMDMLGHTNAAFTLRVYRHGMRHDAASKRALRELVGLTEPPAD